MQNLTIGLDQRANLSVFLTKIYIVHTLDEFLYLEKTRRIHFDRVANRDWNRGGPWSAVFSRVSQIERKRRTGGARQQRETVYHSDDSVGPGITIKNYLRRNIPVDTRVEISIRRTVGIMLEPVRGLWLDGVVYMATYPEGGQGDTNGSHLRDTVFESYRSVKKNQDQKDWHKHSYAMNSELQYDFLYKDSSDPKLTEKSLSRIVHGGALLYIENTDSNVIDFSDIEAIIETGKYRWTSKKIIGAFLGGHVVPLSAKDIPTEDPKQDNESSKFWRGVDVDSFSGGN